MSPNTWNDVLKEVEATRKDPQSPPDLDAVRRGTVPLDQLQCVRCDKKTKQAVEDWHYWVRQGYQFG